MFQDANMIPFFFPNFDWNCCLVSSCSSMFISSRSVISVDGSVSLQKGFLLSWSESSRSWLDSVVSSSAGVIVSFSVSVGLVLSGMVIWLLRWLVSLLTVGILCFSVHVPRLGTMDKSVGVARLHPSLP